MEALLGCEVTQYLAGVRRQTLFKWLKACRYAVPRRLSSRNKTASGGLEDVVCCVWDGKLGQCLGYRTIPCLQCSNNDPGRTVAYQPGGMCDVCDHELRQSFTWPTPSACDAVVCMRSSYPPTAGAVCQDIIVGETQGLRDATEVLATGRFDPPGDQDRER